MIGVEVEAEFFLMLIVAVLEVDADEKDMVGLLLAGAEAAMTVVGVVLVKSAKNAVGSADDHERVPLPRDQRTPQ